jgi:hypothetical protein
MFYAIEGSPSKPMGDEMDKPVIRRILVIMSFVLIAIAFIMLVFLWFLNGGTFPKPLLSDAFTYTSIGFLFSTTGFTVGLHAHKKMQLSRISDILYAFGLFIGGVTTLCFLFNGSISTSINHLQLIPPLRRFHHVGRIHSGLFGHH